MGVVGVINGIIVQGINISRRAEGTSLLEEVLGRGITII